MIACTFCCILAPSPFHLLPLIFSFYLHFYPFFNFNSLNSNRSFLSFSQSSLIWIPAKICAPLILSVILCSGSVPTLKQLVAKIKLALEIFILEDFVLTIVDNPKHSCQNPDSNFKLTRWNQCILASTIGNISWHLSFQIFSAVFRQPNLARGHTPSYLALYHKYFHCKTLCLLIFTKVNLEKFERKHDFLRLLGNEFVNPMIFLLLSAIVIYLTIFSEPSQ